ncbi:MAG: right-handed parallel beta-helix repeat-containing protein, partial [Cyclobacteriaceae bacterium]|nr:right-handed parallel beta-helix repeat-containing protein [Cyclobacteriaceae bacterium]
MIYKKALFNPVYFFILLIVGLSIFNCKPEEEILDFDFTHGLEFSTDTVLFDTVFTGIGSATKRIKVFNPSQNALKISSISLGGGNSSSYKILVNGTEPNNSEDLLILGKDSILILVEVFINPQDENSPYLVHDYIQFETNGITQQINLVAWGQDANYLGDIILACNTTWTNERPYVIYSSILVDTLCNLSIEKGTRIYGSKGAYIYVKGKLHTEGTPEDRIIFRNDRLDPAYENIPGQWGGILFLEGSHGNSMNFTTLRNAEFGIRLGSPDKDTIPDIILKNMIIENMSNSGILSFNSDLYAENVLVNNCIELICGNIVGGNYTYKHCSFANYGFNFIRQTSSFFISDNINLDDNTTIIEDINVEIQNSIIDGNMEDELLFDLEGGANYTFTFINNIIKTSISDLD